MRETALYKTITVGENDYDVYREFVRTTGDQQAIYQFKTALEEGEHVFQCRLSTLEDMDPVQSIDTLEEILDTELIAELEKLTTAT